MLFIRQLIILSARNEFDEPPEYDTVRSFLSQRPRPTASARRKNSVYEVEEKLAVERYIRKRDRKKGKKEKDNTMEVVRL